MKEEEIYTEFSNVYDQYRAYGAVIDQGKLIFRSELMTEEELSLAPDPEQEQQERINNLKGLAVRLIKELSGKAYFHGAKPLFFRKRLQVHMHGTPHYSVNEKTWSIPVSKEVSLDTMKEWAFLRIVCGAVLIAKNPILYASEIASIKDLPAPLPTNVTMNKAKNLLASLREATAVSEETLSELRVIASGQFKQEGQAKITTDLRREMAVREIALLGSRFFKFLNSITNRFPADVAEQIIRTAEIPTGTRTVENHLARYDELAISELRAAQEACKVQPLTTDR